MRIKAYILIISVLTLLVIVIGLQTHTFVERQQPKTQADLFEMSLEELMQVTIEESGALTKTSRCRAPSTVIVLMQGQISYAANKMENRSMATLGIADESDLVEC